MLNAYFNIIYLLFSKFVQSGSYSNNNRSFVVMTSASLKCLTILLGQKIKMIIITIIIDYNNFIDEFFQNKNDSLPIPHDLSKTTLRKVTFSNLKRIENIKKTWID